MQRETVIRGKASQTHATNGWIIGHFMPEGLSHRTDFEVKLWDYTKDLVYPPKVFGGTELIVVYGGTLHIAATFPDGSDTVYVLDGNEHDYLILPPNVTKRVSVLTERVFGVTVRWPSGEGINKVL